MADTADTHDAAAFDENHRIRSFIEESVDGAWRLDLEQPVPLDLPVMEQIDWLYRYAYIGEANQAFAEQYGYVTPQGVVGMRLGDFFPRDLPTTTPLFTGLIQSNYALQAVETIECDRYGNKKVFINNCFGEITDGKLLCIWGTAKDLTRQRQLEAEVHLRAEMFAQVPDGCVIVEMSSEKLLYANPAFTQITGYTAADLGRNKLSILQGKDTDAKTVSKLREAIAQARPFVGEILNYKKDGTPFWNLMRISPIKDADGVVTHYVGILADITERKSIRQSLQEQRAQLAHVTRLSSMSELTAALAHELNQPLAAILSNAQAALRFLDWEEPDIEEVRGILKAIVADDKRAGEVIRRTRRLVRKETGQVERLDVNTLVEEVYALVVNDLSIKQVAITKRLTPDLPEVDGDSIQLQQVILNLVINAGQAQQDLERSERRVVLATNRLGDRSIEISVTDAGPGIEEKIRDQIFKPFFTTKAMGLGMGLAINRSIVEAHGGRLWAENGRDCGAVFHLTLPIAQ